MQKELVIASYDKNLDWLIEVNKNIKITSYRKGELLPLQSNEIKIEPNKGRCVHTFFNHIYENYDKLSEYTFFVQDYPFDHWGNLIDILNGDINLITKKCSLNINNGYFGFHNNALGTAWILEKSTHFENGYTLRCQNNGYPQDLNPNINVDKYWEMLFNENKPGYYEFMPGGHFVITKEYVKLRTKEFYKQIIDMLVSEEVAPWNFERLECYIFNSKYKTKL
jgi:hypothetical protein